MNRQVRSILIAAAAQADSEARDADQAAANVGEPHHSYIKGRAVEWREAAIELRDLLGLPPDADLLPFLVRR